ncbi:hypothetical protein AB0I84_44370 [Streptomyces spectabilis]|uniref:hypothetical protein n=1 Tax=Streptomyces spectabilis TaxID=68270 RepID=UPI003404A06F
MTTCDIRRETDLHPHYGDQLAGLAERVIAEVAAITELPVSDVVTIRLMDQDAFMSTVTSQRQRALARGTEAFALDEWEVQDLQASLASRQEALRVGWLLAPGAMADVDGEPQILIMPEVLHRRGFGEPHLIQLLARLGCHVAQHAAGGGAVFHALNSPCPQRLGRLPGACPETVLGGHAHWAGEQVQHRLLGYAVPVGEPAWTESGTYHQLLRQVEKLMDGAQARDLMFGEFQEGAEWVARVVKATGGVSLLNWLWAYPWLLPTPYEVKDPERWSVRAAATQVAITGTPEEAAR